MCEGGGYCLSLCECSYMKGTEDCNCIIGKHTHYKTDAFRFCRAKCIYECKIQKCKSFKYCGDGFPKWFYQHSNYAKKDSCNTCNIFKVKYPNNFGNCIICNNDKYLIETYCNHNFCLECLIQLNPDKGSEDNPCPVCRTHIEFNEV